MSKKAKASHLYKEGRFNYADITHNPDGTTTITCDGVQVPRPYTFRARHLGSGREELLDDPEVNIEEEEISPAHPEPVEG